MVVILALFSIWALLSAETRGEADVCVQRIPSCEGLDMDCSRSVPCHHGDCNDEGHCLCQRCWDGPNCNQYVDLYAPEFSTSLRSVVVSPEDSGILFTLEAQDADETETCHSISPCPCSEVSYVIVKGNPDGLFLVDPSSGDVIIAPEMMLVPGTQHQLIVSVMKARRTDELDVTSDMQEVNITVLSTSNRSVKRSASTETRTEVPSSVLQSGDGSADSHRIRKRDASTETVLQMFRISGDGDTLSVGDKADFRLEITLTPSYSASMVVEILSSDPENRSMAFAFDLVALQPLGAAISSSVTNIQPVLIANDKITDLNDEILVDFGTLTTPSGASSQDCQIVLTFSAILIKNPPYVVDGKNYSIVTGASYDNENTIWVAQATFTAEVPPDDSQPYPSAVSIDGPDSIAVDSFGMYTLHVFSTMPFGLMRFDVFSNDAPQDSLSTGPIILQAVGANYRCMPDNLLSYPYVLEPSTTEKTTAKSMLKIARVINSDNQGRRVANVPENEMTIALSVYIPNRDDLVGTDLPFSASVSIDSMTIWTSIINVTIDKRKTLTADPASLSIRNSTVTMGLRSSGTILVDVVVPQSKHSDVVLKVLAPTTAQDPPPLSICGLTATFGANIPYAPLPDPQFTSRSGGNVMDQMVVNLGRIWSTGLLSNNDSANTLTLAVTVKAETNEAAGLTVSVQLTDTEGGQATATEVVTVQMDDTDFTEMTSIGVKISDALNSSSLAMETDVGLQLAMTLDSLSYVDSLTLEAMAALGNETFVARICRVEVTSVAKELPCVNKKAINGRVQYRMTDPERDIYDSAVMDLGSVCLDNSSAGATSQSHIDVTVAFELPWQPTAVSGESYTIYSGIKVGSTAIWTGSATYQIADSVPDIMSEGCNPYIEAFASPLQPPSPGAAGLAFVRIKLPPQSRSSYKLQVTSAASENFAICRLIITYLGRGMPCVNDDPWPGNVSRSATTRVVYDTFDDTLQASRSAILDFGAVSNLGDQTFTPEPFDDDNTIVVAVAVVVSPTATANLTLKYALDVGGSSGAAQQASIPLKTSTSAAMTPGNATLSTLDDNQTVHVNVTKVIAFNLQIVPGSPVPITVDFTNPNAAANDYVFCSAAVTFVGKNVPCLNASSISPDIDHAAGDNCSNSLTFSLGDVCYVSVVSDASEDWVTVEVGVDILDPDFTGTVTIQASANVGGSNTPTSSLQLTAINTQLPPSAANVTIAPVSNDSVPAFIRADAWVDVNFTIPRDATIRFLLTASGDSSDGRAVATVKELKVLAAGVNVACVKNSSRLVVEPTTSPSVNTTQKDLLTVDFGYITNVGFTYRQGYPRPWDDQFTLSILVQMTDHPRTEPGAEIPLNVTVETDSTTITHTQLLTVVRNGTEKADILAVANVIQQKLFHSNDMVQVHLLLSHTKASLAEPKETVIRLYLPQYMNYSDNLAANVTVTEVYGSAVSLQMARQFLFEDIYEINFTMTVDPYGKRSPGASTVNATSIGRVLVKVVARTIGGVRYPATDGYAFSGKGFFLVYGIVGEGCRTPLGMNSGQILDCQLSASTAASSDQGPDKARLGSAAGSAWKPALRDQGFRDFLQVDFGNRTRVTQIAFQKDNCCRAPTSIRLQYSDTGFHWSDGYKETALNYTDDTAVMQLPTPFEGRVLRLVIQDADEPENKGVKYIGVRVEFYGCVLAGDISISETCAKPRQTLSSDDVTRYRHFAVDTQSTAVYACDVSATDWKLGCFCSKDGMAWKIIPSYITNIIGYDPVTAFTFATDHKNSSVFKSADCHMWIVSTEAELAEAQQTTDFLTSQVVAGLPRNDPSMTKIVGTWKANYDGLYLSEEKKLSWAT